jgi:hypothetical protein
MSDNYIDLQEEAEAAAMERHDREHPGDPTQWWQDCEICAERVERNKPHEEAIAIDKAIEADAFPHK